VTRSDRGRRAYRLAYDGADYHGFQRQPDVPTVSNAILSALRDLDVLAAEADVPHGYAAAGRTDAGVSAAAQTVAFDAPDWLTPAALNAGLPADVRAWAAADVAPDFHATHDATAREYVYHLHAPDADPSLARQAAEALSGRHDFQDLTPDADGTERDLTADIETSPPFLVLSARAGGFPRHLVRRLVTVVQRVATGEAGPGLVDEVLGPEPLDGPAGIPPAPPEPLVLADVTYPATSFDIDAEATASAREIFEARRRSAATATRVYAALTPPERG
jgi:tRNA pseudouridine38-40 synthase